MRGVLCISTPVQRQFKHRRDVSLPTQSTSRTDINHSNEHKWDEKKLTFMLYLCLMFYENYDVVVSEFELEMMM